MTEATEHVHPEIWIFGGKESKKLFLFFSSLVYTQYTSEADYFLSVFEHVQKKIYFSIIR